MKILHTADWHIGNYNGPEINGENARFLDICKCLDALAAQAAEEAPDFIIIAGDIFHQARVWSDRGLRENQTAIHYIRLLEKVAPVIIVRGTPNHDSEQQYRMLQTAFAGDDSVHIFMEPEVLTVYGYHGQQINVAALPGFDRGFFRAKHPGLDKEEENEVFTNALADIVLGLKAQCAPGTASVLVGHYTITGANTESGQTALFAQYEPVVDPATLAAADFDLVCFGHIHRPQMLDGCKNTFYSGAVSALNFNDEGQERGYYIHEIRNTELLKHRRKFCQLPTRQFLTVRLKDEDIEAINAGDDLSWLAGGDHGVEEKIVRILYDCTDEHNKALNKTMMEQRLYELGAFWVQEITPQNISVTVNKNGLNDDDSPEANLRAYLEEKGTEEAVAGRIVERARPIIAEAVEANMTRRTTGEFVPVEIEVHNYRNYRDEAFSFEPIRFCTINGENGAGKSSLFMDAMCDALFEETREGDITGWICNDPAARSGSIKFTFRLGEATYRVTRTRMKSGKATLNLAELVDGEWTDRSREKFRDTQAEILNTIGMDSLTLKATALIMQDQYGLFLTADKEARMTILGNILGLGAYGDMEEIAADRLTETNRAIRNAQEKAADLQATIPDDTELSSRIAAKTEEIGRLKSEATEKRTKADSLKLTMSTMDEARERAAKIGARMNAASSKKAATEASITAQRGIVFSADEILAERPIIEAGIQELKTAQAREKELLEAKAAYESTVRELDGNKARRITELDAIGGLRKKQAAIKATKLDPAQRLLEQAPALEAQHQQYLDARNAVAVLESKRKAYEDAREAVKEAEKDEALKVSKARSFCFEQKLRLENLTKRARLLDENNCPHAEEVRCRFLADALEARAEIPAAQEAYSEAEASIERVSAAAQEAIATARASVPTDYTPEQEKAARGLLRGLEVGEKHYGELAVARAELKAAQERIDDLGRQIEEREARVMELTAAIEAQERQRTAQQAGMLEYIDTRNRVEELTRLYSEKEKRLPVAEEKKATAQARIAELEATIGDLNREIIELDAEREKEQKKAAGREAVETEYWTLYGEIEEAEARLQSANMALGAMKETQDKARQQREKVAELMERVESLSTEAADLDTLKQAFSQDGIPHDIVRSIIPVFEATATNILGQMSGGHMSVEFVMEKTLKSNSKKEVTALDVIINDSATGRLEYKSRSGGERVKAALAVILALAEIKSTKAGVQLGFLFIDEPPFLDSKGVTAYCDALEAIQSRYADLKVMAITHDPAMKCRFPQSVDIIKTADGSKVIYE